jgi:pyruvate/2-oxoglutarate dehydrogenase complex dihydrolipoamide dehydrogenase (E3) component
VIISTGTHASLEAIPGLSEAQPLTHIEALELDEIPEHLIVIGGGYVGLELSQAMRRFGSRVSIIDRNDRVLHREDKDVSEGIHGLFEDDGIDIVLNASAKSVSGKSGQKVQVVIEQNGVGRHSDCNDCRATIHRAPRSHPDSPDSHRGPELLVRG